MASGAVDPAKADFEKDILPILEDNCFGCHGDGETKGGLALDDFKSAKDVHQGYKTWEQLRKIILANEMPPEGRKKRPNEEERALLAGWTRHTLDTFYRTAPPDPGRVTVRRLNRVEYNNVIRDLMMVDFKPADDFPADDTGYGFDNIGDVLSMSPLLMEKYLDAAEKISMSAVPGDAKEGTRFQKLYFKTPAPKGNQDAVIKQFLNTFMRRAYRREVSGEEVSRVLKVSQMAGEDSGLNDRVRVAVQAVLISPHFLFRWELDGAPDNPKAIRSLNEFELASRLSFFLWSSGPDDRLLDLAAKGELRKGLSSEVERMLDDSRSEALVSNFAGQWLELRSLDVFRPDKKLFPGFTGALRDDMRRETELLFGHVIRENLNVVELLSADYTFLNERLATHYGVPNLKGEQFRKTFIKGKSRSGILGHAGVLTITSDPNRTSPVKRGKYVLENILGTPPPPPPPNVPELEVAGEITGTLREQMVEHRANAVCASCHEKMDPIGFAFEHFDAIGRYRNQDNGSDIDASGKLDTGETFKNSTDLIRVLTDAKGDFFVRCLTEKMMTYALGRGLEYYDKRAVDRVVQLLEKDGRKMQTLVVSIVKSLPFDMKRGESSD